jgi:hypothetical protein
MPILWAPAPCLPTVLINTCRAALGGSRKSRVVRSFHSRLRYRRPTRNITRPLEPAKSIPMDPLVALFQTNLKDSPFYRLPFPILLRIASFLDRCSVESLRRAGRLFLGVCASAFPLDFRALASVDGVNDLLAPWPSPIRPHLQTFWAPKIQKELLRLLERDKYCEGCKAARQRYDWDERVERLLKTYLHCFACHYDHPACLFPPDERVDSNKRACIAHKGAIRLCGHSKLTWSRAIEQATTFPVCRAGVMGLRVLQCHDGSHQTSCRALPLYDHHMGDSTKPEIIGFRAVEGGGYTPYIHLTWRAHLDIEGESGKPLTARLLRSRLADLRRRGGDFIFPRTSSGQLLELHQFDPNRCNCVEFEGAQGVEWPLAPPTPLPPSRRGQVRSGCCRAYFDHFPRPYQQRQSDVDERMRLMRARHGHRRHYTTFSHASTSDVSCFASFGVDPCERNLAGLDVVYLRTMDLYDRGKPGKVNPDWFRSLDPDSYGLLDDTDGDGVFWCRQENCANFFKNWLSRMLKYGDYNRECRCQAANAI